MNELDRLKYCIDRFDGYFEGVNNKNNLVLAINTFIVGGLIAIYSSLTKYVEVNSFFNSFYLLSICIGVFAMLLLILSSMPFLKSSTSSLISFCSISKLNKKDFFKKSKEMSEKGLVKDLRGQTHELAVALQKKFTIVMYANALTAVQFLIFITLIIFSIFNLK